MCGIAGVISTRFNQEHLSSLVEMMKKSIAHRGPDGEGLYSAGNEMQVVLGHRRLAIIDPQHGHQPMITPDKRLAIVFNGAIYNFLELRQELMQLGHNFTTSCDTEVILYAYRQWGKQCVEKLRGMFAFAIWDEAQQYLFCARDRIGIKPFYYSLTPHGFAFSSEIKAILMTDWVQPEMNLSGFADYITFQFCLAEKTLFQNINRLEPGHTLEVRFQNSNITAKSTRYWDLDFQIDTVYEPDYYKEGLQSLLQESIRIHLRSDVPLGAHLSGGLDSSTVVSLATQELKGKQLKTFTGAFREGLQFDETRYAKQVAQYANTDYHEIYISGDGLSDLLPKLMYFMDEPLAGPGLIPQYYVSQLAAQHVKVALGGQGGDELYIGYARHSIAFLEESLKRSIMPDANCDPTANLATMAPHLSLLSTYQPLIQQFWRDNLFGPADERYYRLIDRSEGTRELFNPEVWQTDYSHFDAYQQIFNSPKTDSLINKMAYFDLKTSLPALLHVEDRTSMAVSLESRVPLLDHKLVEFIAKIPPEIKFANGQPKHLFKQTVRPHLPASIVDRTDKMGFPVPLNQWIKGSAKDFAQDLLFSDRTRQRGLFNIENVSNAYRESQTFSRVMWGLLCMELWQRVFVDGDFRKM